eukprot:768523-Hanusia_phi.AAC.10
MSECHARARAPESATESHRVGILPYPKQKVKASQPLHQPLVYNMTLPNSLRAPRVLMVHRTGTVTYPHPGMCSDQQTR